MHTTQVRHFNEFENFQKMKKGFDLSDITNYV